VTQAERAFHRFFIGFLDADPALWSAYDQQRPMWALRALESAGLLTLPAYQLALRFTHDAWRQLEYARTLAGTTS
jgi:hypothetical protein